MLVPAKACLKVPHFIDSEQAALLTVNPLTAYLMLTQFASLKPGDPVIQNLGSSAVGRWVIYFAKRLGLSVTSIIRNEAYKDELLHLGSDSVFLDSERFSQTVAHKGDFKLALNGVGGASAKELCKCLAKDALLLSYGAMSKEPISIGTGLLIFKNLTLKGFNRSLYLINKSVNEINVFYKLIFDFLDQNSFAIPIDSVYELADYKQAFCRLSSSERKGKVLLKLN